MMRFRIRLRMVLTALAISAVLASTGCGQTFRQAAKDGLFGFVSGQLNSSLISAELANFLASVLTTGGLTFL
ncbi:MAG TPA: hypothetical protein VLM89_03630 [Phycisphaerae bacterium]|nr:hypothetical protein [Phycisphaerae bacterium]